MPGQGKESRLPSGEEPDIDGIYPSKWIQADKDAMGSPRSEDDENASETKSSVAQGAAEATPRSETKRIELRAVNDALSSELSPVDLEIALRALGPKMYPLDPIELRILFADGDQLSAEELLKRLEKLVENYSEKAICTHQLLFELPFSESLGVLMGMTGSLYVEGMKLFIDFKYGFDTVEAGLVALGHFLATSSMASRQIRYSSTDE